MIDFLVKLVQMKHFGHLKSSILVGWW